MSDGTQVSGAGKRPRLSRMLLLAAAGASIVGTGFAIANGSSSAADSSQVRFRDVASRSGIQYRRVKSPRDAVADEIKARGIVNANEQPFFPMKSHGAPGVAIFDYDGDGDEDIFATNGPGVAHSLYRNQLRQTGRVQFVDVATRAGVAAVDQDGSGVCFGDTDNDGDKDMVVLGTNGNHFFRNNGRGGFTDNTHSSGIGGTQLTAVSCSMGDVNGDSLLDVVIANNYTNWENWVAMLVEPLALNQHEQLFINQGGNYFIDQGEEAGIKNFPDITWAIAMVDYDQDGDVDIVEATDQAPVPPLEFGGIDRGYLRLYQNDGTGQFTDMTEPSGLNSWGFWMGLAFADFNGDSHLDIFATNIGNYTMRALPVPHAQADGNSNSKWFLGSENGTFTDPGVGELKATPFGWGTSAFDYDNDADSDIVFYGGFEMPLMNEASNPGALLRNQGAGRFTRDAVAFTMKHNRRDVQGVAVGDLNSDGFPDIVSVSASDIPQALPLVPLPVTFGGPFDNDAVLAPTFVNIGGPEFQWNGVNLEDGTLAVEMNSGNNNLWGKVTLLGTAGTISRGAVNRDGIGAVVTVRQVGSRRSVIKPVLGGSSYASQDSLDVVFGMGSRRNARAVVDVLWPGGVRNRLYDVRPYDNLTFPEIPCSYTDDVRFSVYISCVTRAINQLGARQILTSQEQAQFLSSAIRAFREHKRG